MRTFLLLLFTLLAGSAAAQDSAPSVNCKYDDADCRDGCTIDYGSSSQSYDRLGACLKKCKREYDRCLAHQFAPEKEKPKPQAESTGSDGGPTSADGGPTGTDGGTNGADGGTKGADAGSEPTHSSETTTSKPGTRASDSKHPEAEDTSDLDRLYDEQEPSPPPSKSKSKPEKKEEKKEEWKPDWK
jgi:hypothetical protein